LAASPGGNQVFVNLLSLARIAESTPSYKGPTMKSLGFQILSKPTEKRTTRWTNTIQKNGPIYITDIEKQEQEQGMVAASTASTGPVSPGQPRPSPELEAGTVGRERREFVTPTDLLFVLAVRMLERQLEEERKCSQAAIAEARRLEREVGNFKAQAAEAEKKRRAESEETGAETKKAAKRPKEDDKGKEKSNEAEPMRERAGTLLDPKILYEKLKALELKKEQEA